MRDRMNTPLAFSLPLLLCLVGCDGTTAPSDVAVDLGADATQDVPADAQDVPATDGPAGDKNSNAVRRLSIAEL
jgi:hypothetical protein